MRAAVAAGCQTYPPTSYQVCGRIRDKYNQTGGPNGFLLFPKSNELTNPNNTGKRSEFLGGNIYWSTATDAHPVAHEFLTKWGEKGYESGYMKYPTTDEIVLGDGLSRRQEYQGASIYFNFSTGAHIIQGNIREYWRGLGAETSDLGFPTSDEQQIGDKYYNTFQGGTIYWSPSAGYEVFNALKSYRHEAGSNGDGDCDIVTEDPDCHPENQQDKIRETISRCVAVGSTMSPNTVVFVLTGSSKWPSPLKVPCGQYRHINDDHKIELDRERGLQCILMTYAKGVKKRQEEISTPQYRGIDYFNPNRNMLRSTIIYDPTATNTYGKPDVMITAYAGTGEGRDWGGCVSGYMN
ncbi:hypothetical protein [uncultured Williamsia sp.]|uniref:LGFP repeat-containing protein n=1 Tax=uncultured Williamsia sp. TaxID=259311 RepID=UPI0026019254|nr:hypothetical protein [uncultured Williamsia sp.]